MAYGDRKIFYNFFKFIIEKFDFLVEMHPEREVLRFFSEGQIVRISLSLISNAPWVCLSKNTLPVPELFHGGYIPPGPNCVPTTAEESDKYTVPRLSYHPVYLLYFRWLQPSERSMIKCPNPDGSSPWAAAPMAEVIIIIHTVWSEAATESFPSTFTFPDALQLLRP